MSIYFILFVFLVSAEYIGLGIFIPVYNALPIPLLLSFGLFLHVVYKNGHRPIFEFSSAKYLLFFIFLTASAMAHGLIQSYAIDPLKVEVGYFMLLVIAFYLVDDKKTILVYALVFVSVHVFLVMLNINKLGHERMGAFMASFFLGDGNDFAWSLNVALPMAFFVLMVAKNFAFRLIAIGMIGVLLLGIIGTQSRGASLALVSGFLYFFFYVTHKKLSAIIVISIVAFTVVLVAPDNYFNRMETLGNYQEDTSAMGRIHAWRTATEMAVDNPLLGVGAGSFNSSYGRSYRKPNDPSRWISTHSVYFKVLAEYGFPGIFVYLMIIVHSLRINNRTAKALEANPGGASISVLWPKCLNWSIVSWSVGALFLTGLDYPHLFLLVGLSMSASRIVTKELSAIRSDGVSGVEADRKKMWYEDESSASDWSNDNSSN